ncbi:MAG: YibE/F family protein, partial [Oscillospiraceae bacterium]|nr:YibE/F family protein [Oscillospiraceae bacterium]
MERIKKYIMNNKLRVLILSIILVFFVGVLIFVKNDYFLYTKTIVKAINVSETEINSTNDNETEPHYMQMVEAKIMNGKYKGQIIEFTNERSYSGLFDYNIGKGDDVFVEQRGDLSLAAVDGFKRDFWAALEILIFCYVLILVASKRSSLILLSTFINIIVFISIVFLNMKSSVNLLALFSIGTFIFTVITLCIIGGFNKKTFCAIISALISVIFMMTIAVVCFSIFRYDIHYETIEFSEYITEFQNVFYSGVLISGLGAIMDITIIISSAVSELINKNPEISSEELRKSA